MVSGPPASGKTTLATALASTLRYAIVDLDTVTGPLTRVALARSGADEAAIDSPAGPRLRAARYETLLDLAAANLAIGLGVVIAAPFSAERTSPERFRDVVARLQAADAGVRVALLYLDAPDEVVRVRLERRNAPRDRLKLSRGLPATGRRPLVGEAVVIDGTGGIPQQLAQALAALTWLGDRHPGQSRAASC